MIADDVEYGTWVPGEARADVAWERYARPELWPTWAPQITAVETDAPRLAPGVTGRVRGPLGVRVDFTVAAVDEANRTWSWHVRFGPLRLYLRHGVEARSGGSATWVTVRGPGPVVLAYLPLTRIALHRLVRG